VSPSPSPESVAVGVELFVAAAAYALLAGADFGGGIWDLLAGGSRRGAAARKTIDKSVTPVWEANHVWLIFVLVLLWTGFPAAFAAITTTLFIPLSASLLGIILRGVGFAFRHHVHSPRTQWLTSAAFTVGSLLTPFLLGTVIGAIVTGQVRAGGPSGARGLIGAGGFSREVSAWTSLTALLTGVLFVAACAYVAAIYLTGDARGWGETAMVDYFRARAIAAGLVTGTLAGVTFGVLSFSSPYVFGRLTSTALPPVAISVAAGFAALVFLLFRRIRGLRIVAAVAVAAIVAGWGWGQFPYLLPTTLRLQGGSAPASSLLALLAIAGLGVLFVAPGFAMLFWLHQRGVLEETPTTESLRQAMRARALETSPAQQPQTLAASVDGDRGSHPVAAKIMITAVAAGAIRDMLAASRARRRGKRGR
jgi:cytochrome bd ubiquinol oxidase subunit II